MYFWYGRWDSKGSSHLARWQSCPYATTEMVIDRLVAENFKNYSQLEVVFSDRFNCILGLNGSGKTNLLNAIHYLVMAKSAFSSTGNEDVQHGSRHFLLKGRFLKEGESHEVVCYQELRRKRAVSVDGRTCQRISDHVGTFHVVMSTPYDIYLIQGHSENRRKWLNGFISSFDQQHLGKLLEYTKILRQRNALLNLIRSNPTVEQDRLLDVYDGQIIRLSMDISTARRDCMQALSPVFQSLYARFVSRDEPCDAVFSSAVLRDGFEATYARARSRDVLLKQTSQGCHRDDIHFQMDQMPVKKFGSQGQQKSFLIALRLAQHHLMTDKTGGAPILLLDDVFEKLDVERMQQLMTQLGDDDRFGQVMITDANPNFASKAFHPRQKVIKIAGNTLSQ